MTTPDKTKAQILAGLLTIAGFTWFFAFRMGSTETTQQERKPKPIERRVMKDPTIQIGSLHKPVPYESQKNIFQYAPKPLSLPATKTLPALEATVSNTKSAIAELRVSLEPPPSKTFKYEGFSVKGATATGRILASLSEGGNTYAVTLGECLMGQYCVRQITENMIEIEDLQNRQRRSIPKTLQ